MDVGGESAIDKQLHSMLSVPYGNNGVPAYLATAETKGTRPAIILIHEVWGLTSHIIDVANRLSAEGYEVLAPDLFHGTDVEKLVDPELAKVLFIPEERIKHQAEIRAMMTPIHSPEFSSSTVKRLQACFQYLKDMPQISKVAVMGFCFGGTYSFNLAINAPGLAAAVAYYGHCEHDDEEIARIQSPILAFYGSLDANLMEKLPDLQKQMQKMNKSFTAKVYPDAMHAFFNDTNPITFSPEAAKDSWNLALKFLSEKLA
jgi:carboxymethylenebutenolidase